MAKRRQIHPEIWTDTKFVTLSPLARLLFIGMWNFACDNGHIDDDALQLKMRVLPADNCEVPELLDELLASGMVVRADGYLKVVNLPVKQVLDLRYLVFCDHCANDPDRHYADEDKPGNRRAPRVPPASTTRAPDERTTSALRSGDGDGDGDGDVPATQASAGNGQSTGSPDNAMAILASLGLITADLRRQYLAHLKERSIEHPTRFIRSMYSKGELRGDVEDWLADRDAANIVALRQPTHHYLTREHVSGCTVCQTKLGGPDAWEEALP